MPKTTEKWLDDDGETWLMDPYKEILTDTDRARLAGRAPELLAACERALGVVREAIKATKLPEKSVPDDFVLLATVEVVLHEAIAKTKGGPPQ